MNSKTRMHIPPGVLIAALGVVAMLALMAVMVWSTGPAQAQTGPTNPFQQTPTMDPGATTTPTPTPDPSDSIKSDSTSASGAPEIKLIIDSLGDDRAVGSSIVLYLEDDFQEPDSIPAGSVYIVAEGTPDNVVAASEQSMADAEAVARRQTGNGSRVYVTTAPKLKTSSYFDRDKKDIAIRVLVPDMCTNATDECEGPNGLRMGQMVTLVIESDSGIKNPSEQKESGGMNVGYKTGYDLLGPTGDIKGRDKFSKLNNLLVNAKIGLSDVDNKRGYEMTVTGSGFNDGTTAGVYVLHIPGSDHEDADMRNMYIWNQLDCDEMNDAFGLMDDERAEEMDSPCTMYNGLDDGDQDDVDMEDYFSSGYPEAALCDAIIRKGTEVGSALVGSDDKVAVTFEVTAPTFGPGNTNHICMVDGEGRMSNTDVEDFKLQPSIKVVPVSANSGDTVNVFAQDFSNDNAGFTQLKLAGDDITGDKIARSERNIGSDGSGEVAFKVPGGYEGTLRIDAKWCTSGEDPVCISENTKITLAGAQLNASKTDVLPNETITITGNGFGSQTCIPISNFKLEDVAVMVDDESAGGCTVMMDDGTSERGVEVSNSGQFVATIILWPAGDDTNPTLIPGTHRLSVEDTREFSSTVDITIPEPSIKVTPDVAGPRDYITITGENWPVDNPENPSSIGITVEVSDTAARARQYTLFADGVGRITQEHRVHRNVSIPSTVQVKMTYGDVAKIGSFTVPASTIEVSPNEGQPGDMVTLTAGNMKVYTQVDYVEIGGTRNDDPGVNTDRDGNVTVEGVLIPGLDPGVYSVVIAVGGKEKTIAIGEITVLAESSAAGAPAELPGATENLGDNLVAIFHFDDVGKSWSFHDPRPEFADLNTLTEMVNGEAYWILVSETVDDVVLNNKVRSLTCRGSDCWNLEVW